MEKTDLLIYVQKLQLGLEQAKAKGQKYVEHKVQMTGLLEINYPK